MKAVTVIITPSSVAVAGAALLLLYSSLWITSCHGFVVPPSVPSSHFKQQFQLAVVLDPTMMVDASIAVFSAAAGAASQFPRIQELERQLHTAREALTASELELVHKITELEDKLFQMDNEYEQATARFKKQYDTRMQQDLERITDKIKVDFQYKLEIRLEEQKSKMLQDKLELVNGLTGGKQEELVDLRIRNSRVQRANQELEQALEASRVELAKLQAGAKKRKGWWPF